MRIAWASTTFLAMIFQWQDIDRYYGGSGIIPTDLIPLVLRSTYRFSLLIGLESPWLAYSLYVLLLASLIGCAVGWRTRWTTIASLVLLLSFYERNKFLITGGELVLRSIGFILAISPGIDSYSLDRYRRGASLVTTMPIWPYRMLLWQMIVMYVMTVWFQQLGTTWRQGTAMILVFQHPFVSFWAGTPFVNRLAVISRPLSWALTLWKSAWALMLLPHAWQEKIFRRGPSLKQWLIIGGLLFHGSSLILLDLGSFSMAILVGYLGLLADEDVAAISSWVRAAMNWKQAARSDAPDIS